jgi:hypothetical protein
MLETWPKRLQHAYGRIFQPDRESFDRVSTALARAFFISHKNPPQQ